MYKIGKDGKYEYYTKPISISESVTIYAKIEEIENSEKSYNVNINSAITITYDANLGALDTFEYNYTGNEQIFIAPRDGYYKLEVWGAQGGNASSVIGGYGGYSVGIVELKKDDKLYINVGGMGAEGVTTAATITQGGYNGGGNGFNHATGTGRYVGAGGGATHIATESGILSSLSQYAGNNDSPILIVAGGGSGGNYFSEKYTSTAGTGSGGGYIGVTGTGKHGSDKINKYADGGVQTSAGSKGKVLGKFGLGASGTNDNAMYSGGGGGYYGGNSELRAAGGGSGYIGNTTLTKKAMYCYNCIESDEETKKTISTTNVGSHVENYANTGNGYARISSVVAAYNSSENYFPTPSRTGRKFIAWRAENGEKITDISLLNKDTTLKADWNTTCTLSVSDTTVSITKSDDAISYGISTSTTPTYNNSSTYTISSTGDIYGYVKDEYGNTNKCSLTIGTTKCTNTDCSACSCENHNYGGTCNCLGQHGSTNTPVSGTCVKGSCSCGGSLSVYQDNCWSTCVSYKKCSKCKCTSYGCVDDGYIKINNSYCYKVN